MKIIFFGTPDFAVASLDILVKNGYDIAAVVTMPDKQAGRGHKLLHSAVKEYALNKNLPLLQPEKLKDESFINKLESFNADLFIVVAFRMLPEIVWNMPPKGTFNLHASLLPQYRGAAPINWALINGEKETGVTTFFLQHEIDTGNIILQEKIAIEPNDNAETLHDKLMALGAGLILRTVKLIESGDVKTASQTMCEELKPAPKIFKETCKINWNDSCENIRNFVRGLSPYPAAWCNMADSEGNETMMKIFEVEALPQKGINCHPGKLSIENGQMFIDAKDGKINILSLQISGKKRMSVNDFLRGFKQIKTVSIQ